MRPELPLHSEKCRPSDVFVVPVFDKYLLYAPCRRVAALLNRKAVDLIAERILCRSEMISLSGPLNDIAVRLAGPQPDGPRQHTSVAKPPFLGIIPSRNCNLSCAYCGFGSGSGQNERMDITMAAAAVDWMAEHRKAIGGNLLEIHFFGGEPFIEKEIVDVVVHRARFIADRLGMVPRFEASTNGVFDEEYASFIGDYFDSIVLSFDGRRDVHDRHRPFKTGRGSFDAVARTARILSRSPVELCFRCCVSKDNVFFLDDIGQWFCDTFSPSIINFEILKPTPESKAAGLTPPDPYDFAVNYERAKKRIEVSGVQTVYASAETSNLRHSFCPVGKDTLIVSPDGRVSSCYLPSEEWKAHGLDMDVGRLGSDGEMVIDAAAVDRLRRLVTDKPNCAKCFCRWTCAGGCHVSHSYPGASPGYNDFCVQTRIITACALLGELEMGQEVEKLIESRKAMERLALNESDRIEDWEHI